MTRGTVITILVFLGAYKKKGETRKAETPVHNKTEERLMMASLCEKTKETILRICAGREGFIWR